MKRCNVDFGKQIKKRLVDLNMTQVELADQLGISKQYLYKILVGERSGARYIDKIKSILNLDDKVA